MNIFFSCVSSESNKFKNVQYFHEIQRNSSFTYILYFVFSNLTWQFSPNYMFIFTDIHIQHIFKSPISQNLTEGCVRECFYKKVVRKNVRFTRLWYLDKRNKMSHIAVHSLKRMNQQISKQKEIQASQLLIFNERISLHKSFTDFHSLLP